jgi:hypothetical protein
MFLRSLHKDFLNAAKAETRSADGRGISTEASDREQAGKIRERWHSMETLTCREYPWGRLLPQATAESFVFAGHISDRKNKRTDR